jgi:hypothetical protein
MSWSVGGTKKGGWPLTVEKRKSHKVTVIRNVRGDPGALVTELKNALGAGGVAREGCIEIQGRPITFFGTFPLWLFVHLPLLLGVDLPVI